MPEGCVDIQINGTMLDGPITWYHRPYVAQESFWRDERGLHAAWFVEEEHGSPVHLIVSSFDAETGKALQHRSYEPFPSHLTFVDIGIQWAAAASDGTFAVLVGYHDYLDPEMYLAKIVFGSLDDPTVFSIVPSPWSADEGGTFHLGWDGQAFAVHASSSSGPEMLLARLSWNGKDVTTEFPSTPAGQMGVIFEDDSAFRTDAASGTTWSVFAGGKGTWVNAHRRDGEPLPGAPQGQPVLVEPKSPTASKWGFGGDYVSVGPANEQAMLAWSNDNGEVTYLQRVGEDFAPLGDVIEAPYLRRKIVARRGDGWWLAGIRNRRVIDAFELDDSSVRSSITLVSNTNDQMAFDARRFATAAWGDEFWFAFRDGSDCFTDEEHPEDDCSYRIVRVKEGCSYKSMFDLHGVHGSTAP